LAADKNAGLEGGKMMWRALAEKVGVLSLLALAFAEC
jgi:hypothetical protein